MNPANDRLQLIRGALLRALSPTLLTINDDSHLHIGHTGTRNGGGHFAVHIISPLFAGKTAVQRHRMVYDALGTLMATDIHALSITAKTPEEHS